MKPKLANVRMIAGIIICTIGVIIFAVLGIVSLNKENFKKDAEATTGYITEIDSYRSNGETHHRVYIEYRVDGKSYSDSLNYWDATMHEGMAIDVYYLPDNPEQIITESASSNTLIMVVGGIFFGLGALLLFADIKHNISVRKLVSEGRVCNGVIVDVIMDTSQSSNGVHPYQAKCQVINGMTGESEYYYSESYNQDMSYLIGRSVTVYVDRLDGKKGVVDLESAFAEYNNSDSQKVFDYR